MCYAPELNAFLDADFARLGDEVTAQPELRFLNSAMGALEAPHQGSGAALSSGKLPVPNLNRFL